jgi:hypothetical protein
MQCWTKLYITLYLLTKLTRQSLLCCSPLLKGDEQRGGKSGLHRAECQVTPGGLLREQKFTTSATESKPPMAY